MYNSSDNPPVLEMVSDHDVAVVKVNAITGQKSLHATRSFVPGDLISSFHAGEILPYATRMTVQVGTDKHITLEPEFLQYTNHSCSPTAFFDTTSMELIALITMEAGDEITFFYPSTEWEMASPFTCQCGSPDCLGEINGASRLPLEVLDRYKLTDYIASMVRQHR